MPSKVVLTEEEYLHTGFSDLDREFRDGEVVERSMPDWFHAQTQGAFQGFLWMRRKQLGIDVVPELRVRLRTGRHVIPDVSVFWPAEPRGSAADRLPVIVIEVISPEDRMTDVRDKLQEYADAGVPHIWLVDPRRKVFYLFQDGLHEVKSYTVAELSLTVAPAEIFA